MTNQEIFDIVACHLLRQGRKAMNDDYRCLYRAPDGCKCAAGVLIPDAVYHPSMEGAPIDTLILRTPALFHLQNSRGVAETLQQVHDFSRPEDWLKRLADVAMRFKLSGAVLRWHFAFPMVQS